MKSGFFRVDGADLETGEESYLVLQAATVAEAESVARKQGLLIAAVRSASSADWGATNGYKKRTPPAYVIEPVIKFESRTPSAAAVAEKIAPPEPPAQDEVEPFDLIDTEPAEALPASTSWEVSIAQSEAEAAASDEMAPTPNALEFAMDAELAAVETEMPPQASAVAGDEPPPIAIDFATEDSDETLVTMSDTETDLSLAEEEELEADLGSLHESATATIEPAPTPPVPVESAPEPAIEEVKLEAPPIELPIQPPPIEAAPTVPSPEMEMSSPGAVIAPTPLMSSSAPVIHSASLIAPSAPRHDPSPAASRSPSNARPSVFADAPLSAEVASWATSRPGEMPAKEKPALPKSAEPVRAEPIAKAPMDTATAAPTAVASPAQLKTVLSIPAAAPATSTAPAAPAAASSDITAESSVDTETKVKETPPAEETITESIPDSSSLQAESTPPTSTAKEQPTVVKAVAVTAKPVMIPKMGLSDSLRRVAPSRGGQGSSTTSRLGPGSRTVQPAIANPVAKVITIVPSQSSVDKGAASSSGSTKPPATPRPIAATVVSPRRLGRTSPAVAPRRSPQATTLPAFTAEISGKPTAGPTAKSSDPISRSGPAVVEAAPPSTTTVSNDSELDSLFGKIADDSPAKIEDDLQIGNDSVPSGAAAPAVDDLPVSGESLNSVTAASISPEKAVPATRLKGAAEAAALLQAAPTIAGSSAVTKPPSIGFSPLVFLVLVPLAALLTLGGIALIVMTQLTAAPTAAIEFEKLDFHLQMLGQIFLGGIALLGGLLLLVVAGLVHVSRLLRRGS